MKKKIIGIGNAIVDILCKVDDSFLQENDLKKNSMSLIFDDAVADKFSALKSEKITSGGSAGNTIAALSQLGVATTFIGKVGNDDFGKKFISEIEKSGSKYLSCDNHQNFSAKSFIFVTPDAARTMCTYLGCASQITQNDINEDVFKNAALLYLEGYLWDEPQTILALKKAISGAKKNGVKVAFSLSDSFCVSRHRDEFLELIKNDLDILFANEAEALELAENYQEIFQKNSKLIAAITKSEQGCTIINNGEILTKSTVKVEKLLDTTGAGDCFAAGFLYGLIHGYDLEKCASSGNLLAGQIIQKIGARFEENEIKSLKIYDFVD